MPAPNPLIALVREWIAKAENDLTNAVHTLKQGAQYPSVRSYLPRSATSLKVNFLPIFSAASGLPSSST
jgi:hypothetical protein